MARTTDHKEGKATVKIIYRKAKTLADGSHPFWVRITKNRKTTFIATGHSLLPKYWNDHYTGYREAIRKSYPEPNRNNLLKALDGWERKYSSAAESLALSDEIHDAKEVASKAIEGRSQTRQAKVLAYIDELAASMEKTGKVGNALVYKDLRNQLVSYLKGSHLKTEDVRFTDLTVKFLNGFENHMRQRSVLDTTLSNRFRTLRSVFNKAISEGLAEIKDYPFSRNASDKHKFSIAKFDTSTRKRAVGRADIRKIENYLPTPSATGPFSELRNSIELDRLQRAKDVFLFSFYVGGINFVDLAQLRWRDLTVDDEGHTRVNYTRQKTGGKFSLRLLPPALAIIEKQRPITFNNPHCYIFGILHTDVHKAPTQIKNRLKKIISQTNTDLKIIGEKVGISTPLTTYVARHAMATSLRRAGVTDAVTSQIMGHKNEAVTTIYLDEFTSETLDAAFDALL